MTIELTTEEADMLHHFLRVTTMSYESAGKPVLVVAFPDALSGTQLNPNDNSILLSIIKKLRPNG